MSDGLGGIGIDLNPRKIMSLMRNPGGIADLLCEETATGDSPAEIFADLINIMRADVSRLAQHHGVEIEVELMTPERAGALLAGVVAGDGVELVQMFNRQAQLRDAVLMAILDDVEYEQHNETKNGIMHTTPADDDADAGLGEAGA